MERRARNGGSNVNNSIEDSDTSRQDSFHDSEASEKVPQYSRETSTTPNPPRSASRRTPSHNSAQKSRPKQHVSFNIDDEDTTPKRRNDAFESRTTDSLLNLDKYTSPVVAQNESTEDHSRNRSTANSVLDLFFASQEQNRSNNSENSQTKNSRKVKISPKDSFVHSNDVKQGKKRVKPLYAWETKSKLDNSDNMSDTSTGSNSSAIRLQESYRAVNERNRKQKKLLASDSRSPNSTLELKIKLTPEEFQQLQDRRRKNEDRIGRQSPVSSGNNSYDFFDDDEPVKPFLRKGDGKQAYVNVSCRSYLSGISTKQVPLANMNSLGETSGMYITSTGPYTSVEGHRTVDKSKWMSRETFKTAGQVKEFYRDRSLPPFISSGVPYESANEESVRNRMRADQVEKFVSPRQFISSVPSSSTGFVDKQYAMGAISPNRSTLSHHFSPARLKSKHQ
jgi:hypothetical protein